MIVRTFQTLSIPYTPVEEWEAFPLFQTSIHRQIRFHGLVWIGQGVHDGVYYEDSELAHCFDAQRGVKTGVNLNAM